MAPRSRTGLAMVMDAALGEESRDVKPPSKDLVFSETSPSFCIRDQLKASPGTTGRKCKPLSPGDDSCQHLCCGRG